MDQKQHGAVWGANATSGEDTAAAHAGSVERRGGRSSAMVPPVTRRRESGEKPGLTRNGMGATQLGPSPNTHRVAPETRTLLSR